MWLLSPPQADCIHQFRLEIDETKNNPVNPVNPV